MENTLPGSGLPDPTSEAPMQKATMKNSTGYTLPDQEEKASYLQKNFDEIAASYDRFNDLFTGGMHRLWKKRTIRKALDGIQTGTMPSRVQVLDLCSGSGDIALGFARNEPDRRVLALDFSAKMLGVLNAKRPSSMTNLNIVQGDAMNLPQKYHGIFDIVSIGYGIRNLSDPRAGLEQTFLALRPGGMLVILEVGDFSPGWIEPMARIYMEKIIPVLGRIAQGKKHEMYEYLPTSAKAFPGAIEFTDWISDAGFENVQFERYMFGASILYSGRKPLS
ncbi:MAG: hypothetical protein CMF59_11405 [Leptospiraceae bacterium]|nr:hypothetical protein [Leptospiraceae bacterium]